MTFEIDQVVWVDMRANVPRWLQGTIISISEAKQPYRVYVTNWGIVFCDAKDLRTEDAMATTALLA